MCRGLSGPHDSGNYNSHAWETSFFVSQGGSWDSEYGRFFLSWYSGLLLKHADRLLGAAASALRSRGRPARAKREPVQVRSQPVRPSLFNRYEAVLAGTSGRPLASVYAFSLQDACCKTWMFRPEPHELPFNLATVRRR